MPSAPRARAGDRLYMVRQSIQNLGAVGVCMRASLHCGLEPVSLIGYFAKKKKSLSFHEISHTSLYLFPLRFVCSGKALLFHRNAMRKRENSAFRGSVVNIKNEGAFSKNNRIYP